MRTYLLSFGAGILVGIIYSRLKDRSPARPAVALAGLAGICLGEQVISIGKQMLAGPALASAEVPSAVRQPRHRDVAGHGRSGGTDPPVYLPCEPANLSTTGTRSRDDADEGNMTVETPGTFNALVSELPYPRWPSRTATFNRLDIEQNLTLPSVLKGQVLNVGENPL